MRDVASSDGEDLDDWVRRAVKGDAAAREQLFERCLPALRAFVRLRCPPELRRREAASDIVQSACREALGHLHTYTPRPNSTFRAWLFKITGNKLLEKLRRARAQRRDVTREVASSQSTLDSLYRETVTASELLGQREDVSQFEDAFDRLDPEHREVILWSRITGLPHRETAARMNRSEVAVRSLLSRALARLAALIESPEHQIPVSQSRKIPPTST
ncbi:MAG: RNA polymerase sigma-70 factor (subfamily 1) [Planctomycetota bacterium]|jgi:RNA polymerase sigma-70 factor (subfamily 1)